MNSSLGRSTPPAWLEIVLMAPIAQAEAAADFLISLTGKGVEVKDLETPEDSREVRAYLPVGAELAGQRLILEQYVERLAGECEPGRVAVRFQEMADQDWHENWKKYFRPRAVTRRLVVCPPWEMVEPRDEQMVLVIDPGQAFGTGQHESTKLCLQLIEDMAAVETLPDKVLDVGCGTGILAMAALMYGSRQAVAIDLDPLAVEATRDNARANGLMDRLEVSDTPLEEMRGCFGLVMANITANDLTAMAPLLSRNLAEGGHVVVSGILNEQVDQVAEAFQRLGLREVERLSLSGWAALVLG